MNKIFALAILFAILATCPACETETKMEAQTKPTIETESAIFTSWYDQIVNGIPVAVHFASDLDSETLREYVVMLTDNSQNENEIISRDKPENGGLGIVIRVQSNFDFETEEAWSMEWGS